MSVRNPKEQPISTLDAEVAKSHPLVKHAMTEFRKEISRLHKQLVKEQIAHESETEKLRAQLEQAKAPQFNIAINRDSSPK
ncbi:MAG TPA: hypothetical protein VIW72_05805 [Burkholderiales bacterium]